jgi:succinate dehydrogenase / fumarate reductase cytochrome b subunit
MSLTSESTFARLGEVAGNWWLKIILLGIIWAVMHHLIAGIRYLALDLHMGVDKENSQRTALWVYFISVPLTVIAALRLFGVF